MIKRLICRIFHRAYHSSWKTAFETKRSRCLKCGHEWETDL